MRFCISDSSFLLFNFKTKIAGYKSCNHIPKFMNQIAEDLKKKIEDMQNTKVNSSEETIGEKVRREKQDKWVNNHVEAIVNTILAMHQRWESTAEPRFLKYQKEHHDIDTLYKMRDFINTKSEKEFCKEILGFNITKNQNWRYEMLKDMVNAFIKYQEDMQLESDEAAMLKWANEFELSNENDPIMSINQVGLATVQNLRLCLGINTIKPDVHIKNALVNIGLGNDVQICELVSELTGIPCRDLDQIFWHWGQKQSK